MATTDGSTTETPTAATTSATNENKVAQLAQSNDDGSFKDKMIELLSDVINLEVKTVLTAPEPDGDQTISTKINLLDGDITNTIPKGFIEPEKAVDFHLQQVVKAEQIIKSNIETLKSLANTIKDDLG